MMQVRSLFGDVVERWPLAEGKNIFLFLFLFFIEISLYLSAICFIYDLFDFRGKIGFVIPKMGLPITYIRNTYLGKVIS